MDWLHSHLLTSVLYYWPLTSHTNTRSASELRIFTFFTKQEGKVDFSFQLENRMWDGRQDESHSVSECSRGDRWRKSKPINIIISLIRSGQKKQKLFIKIHWDHWIVGIEDQATSLTYKTLLDRLQDRIIWAQEIIFVHLVWRSGSRIKSYKSRRWCGSYPLCVHLKVQKFPIEKGISRLSQQGTFGGHAWI